MPAQLGCLGRTVYFEARRSSAPGQVAVAFVVMNRLARQPAYPATICGVTEQAVPGRGCQFSWFCDGLDHTIRDARAWRNAIANSCLALLGSVPDPSRGALAYHSTTSFPDWAKTWRRTAVVGGHVFYAPP